MRSAPTYESGIDVCGSQADPADAVCRDYLIILISESDQLVFDSQTVHTSTPEQQQDFGKSWRETQFEYNYWIFSALLLNLIYLFSNKY